MTAGYEVVTSEHTIAPGTALVRQVISSKLGNRLIVVAGWRQTNVSPERLGFSESGPSDDQKSWVFSVVNEGFKPATVRLHVIFEDVMQFGGAVPVATSPAAGKARVEFDTPTPSGDLLVYKVTKTTGTTGTDAPLEGTPTVSGNRTTLNVSATPAGTYTFTVTATRNTTGATATSQPSAAISVT